MKILIVTDIHSDDDSARTAYLSENPDLVLDCGDHKEMSNISEFVPHYFVPGNHEPEMVMLNSKGFPLPHSMRNGVIYLASNKNETISFAGIGGNYSNKPREKHVNSESLKSLSGIEKGSIDILMFHESPLNSIKKNNLAKEIFKEIKRISPTFVFSGHTGKYSYNPIKGDGSSKENIHMYNLEDSVRGYGILDTELNLFERKISRWR